ncbi:activator of (R)-2-hydroxyglutaryl-CoA dehydratase [bacterium]|nr:activator of (R)-2-hydroxyglutaryl-CoA dehydratase [bacterium]
MASGTTPRGLPLDEATIQERLAAARQRLEAEAGLVDTGKRRHYATPKQRPFLAHECAETTLLFGGLTWKHDQLIQSALESLGYRCAALPTPDVAAFQIGREFGNNGQCNPTYFTVGNLVQYLQGLEAQGLSRAEIAERYVFFTAGACGPCRFGMYENEYRLALRNAGFEGLRVIVFQQSGGLDQEQAEAGLALNLDFFLAILYAMMLGDLLGEVANQIRPYERETGATDRALRAAVDDIGATLRARRPFVLAASRGRALRRLPGGRRLDGWAKFLAALRDEALVAAAARARARFDAVAIDPLRAKPRVKVTGEFWAQTTEGDGNFNMFRFLEREGAEVLTEPVATWILYMVQGAQNKIRDRKGLAEGFVVPSWRRPRARAGVEWRAWRQIRRLDLAARLFEREYARLRLALGGTAHAPVDQLELERMGHPFYNSRAGGGEGHLEVAKNIYYHNKGLAHMVLSLKPFGCMPSTQSDGAQAAVQSRFPDMIYLPIETSGEGEINAHSRVQMALGEARVKAREEFERAVAASGYSLEALQAGLARVPELARPLARLPHRPGIVGRAALTALALGERLRAAGVADAAPPAATLAAAGGLK